MSRLRWLLGLLLLHADAGDGRSGFRYLRAVTTAGAGESCATLDPLIFAHAAESLGDLHLRGADGREIPYVITVSGTAATEDVTIPVRHVEQHGGLLTFDLEMPHRPYSEVTLDLAGTDFVAVATVRGGESASSMTQLLGQFAVFDLSRQHLPRSTTLALAETSLPWLHIALRAAAGGHGLSSSMVRGATVPPSREAQTVYTTALRSSDFVQRGQETTTSFAVPARVPIERVLFTLDLGSRSDFSRAVQVDARPREMDAAAANASSAETLTGVIAQLHTTRDGVRLAVDRMTVPATLGANLQSAATVEVAIENGANPPLAMHSVELQSRERRICFDAPQGAAPVTLYYGAAQKGDAVERAAGITGSAAARPATLGAEQLNPAFVERVPARSFTRRHPRLFSLGLLLVVCLGGVVALRSTKLRV